MKHKKWQPLVGLAALVILALACGPFSEVTTGSTQNMTTQFEADDVETLDASIDMGSGDLIVGAGSTELVTAMFEFNVDDWEPIVESNVSGDSGTFSVEQPNFSGLPFGDGIINNWDIQFDDNVALNLSINLGAGSSNLDLAELNLHEFSLDAGAGDVELTLGGGELDQVDISAGVGEFVIDLIGDWKTDATINIDGGVGDVRLTVPKDVGVIINVSLGVGDINADGLNQDGDTYTNDAYGESDVTLTIDISGGVGQITLDTQ